MQDRNHRQDLRKDRGEVDVFDVFGGFFRFWYVQGEILKISRKLEGPRKVFNPICKLWFLFGYRETVKQIIKGWGWGRVAMKLKLEVVFALDITAEITPESQPLFSSLTNNTHHRSQLMTPPSDHILNRNKIHANKHIPLNYTLTDIHYRNESRTLGPAIYQRRNVRCPMCLLEPHSRARIPLTASVHGFDLSGDSWDLQYLQGDPAL